MRFPHFMSRNRVPSSIWTFLVEMTSVKGEWISVSWVTWSKKLTPFLLRAMMWSLPMLSLESPTLRT